MFIRRMANRRCSKSKRHLVVWGLGAGAWYHQGFHYLNGQESTYKQIEKKGNRGKLVLMFTKIELLASGVLFEGNWPLMFIELKFLVSDV